MEDKIECGCQWFSEDSIQEEKLFEMMALAHIYMENIGPMIMVCSEEGYDFLARNSLEELYIDVIIVPDQKIDIDLVNKLTGRHVVIENSLQDCSEKMRNLYSENEHSLGWLKDKVSDVLSKEQSIRSI